MKTCSKCKQLKSVDEFHNQQVAADKKDPYCKQCRKLVSRQYSQNNRGNKSQYNKVYYWRNTLEQKHVPDNIIEQVIAAIREKNIQTYEIKELIRKLKETQC